MTAAGAWADRWPEGLPRVGDFVTSFKDREHLKTGRIVAVFAARTRRQRAIRAPTVLVQWRRGEAVPPCPSRVFDSDRFPWFRELRVLRPATAAEIAAWLSEAESSQ